MVWFGLVALVVVALLAFPRDVLRPVGGCGNSPTGRASGRRPFAGTLKPGP